MILVRAADDMVDRDPLLVLDMSKTEAGLVVRPIERLAAVPLHPVAAQVIRVRDVDFAVRMQTALPEGVERQRGLVDAPLGVEVSVGIGVVRPAGRHRLGADGGALIALHLVGRDRSSVLDRI